MSRKPWDILQLVERPMPTPGHGQVLVKVHAVGLNPGVYTMMKPWAKMLITKPAIPETDLSGTIVSVGDDVHEWAVGDNVYGVIPATEFMKKGQGALTQYALLHTQYVYVSNSNAR